MRRCRESRNRTVLLEIDRWEQRLEESGDSQLAPIAENLRQLRALLTADTLDGTAIGLLLGVLGEQVHGVASGAASGRVSVASCGYWVGCSLPRGAPCPIGIDRGASEGSTSGEVHRLVLPDNACSVGISKSEKRVEADEIRTALGSSSRSCTVACGGWIPKWRSRLSGVGKAAGDLRRPQTRACGREPGRSEA